MAAYAALVKIRVEGASIASKKKNKAAFREASASSGEI